VLKKIDILKFKFCILVRSIEITLIQLITIQCCCPNIIWDRENCMCAAILETSIIRLLIVVGCFSFYFPF